MIPFLRNTFRRRIVAKVRTIYESARKITEFFPELCFLWTKVGVFGDETGGFFLDSGLPPPYKHAVETFERALRPRKASSKPSKRLCDPEKPRRNFRKGFATPKSLVETFERALRPRKASSKPSKRLCDLEKPRRNLRKGFATPKSVVVTFEKALRPRKASS